MSEIRIIGGEFKGKKISFPNKINLRPTPNRVREMLFNWLMYDIKDASCLDLYAGSGALGFEAYSRGAKEVVLVEKDNTAYKYLEKNLVFFLNHQDFYHHKYLKVIHAQAQYFLKHNKKQFDIVFLDPPFKSDYLKVIDLLLNTHAFCDNALLYVESALPVKLNEDIFKLLKIKKSGEVNSHLYQKL